MKSTGRQAGFPSLSHPKRGRHPCLSHTDGMRCVREAFAFLLNNAPKRQRGVDVKLCAFIISSPFPSSRMNVKVWPPLPFPGAGKGLLGLLQGLVCGRDRTRAAGRNLTLNSLAFLLPPSSQETSGLITKAHMAAAAWEVRGGFLPFFCELLSSQGSRGATEAGSSSHWSGRVGNLSALMGCS